MQSNTASQSHTPVVNSTVMRGQTRQAEYRRAASLIVIAVALLLICKPWGSTDYYYVPLISGGGFVLSAIVGGRGSRLMGPALPVMFWGVAKVLTSNFHFTGDYALTTGMIGLGVIAAWALHEAKLFPSNSFAAGAGIVWIGLGMFIHGQYGEWVTYYSAMLFGVAAIFELASISTARNQPSHLDAASAQSDLPAREAVSTPTSSRETESAGRH